MSRVKIGPGLLDRGSIPQVRRWSQWFATAVARRGSAKAAPPAARSQISTDVPLNLVLIGLPLKSFSRLMINAP